MVLLLFKELFKVLQRLAKTGSKSTRGRRHATPVEANDPCRIKASNNSLKFQHLHGPTHSPHPLPHILPNDPTTPPPPPNLAPLSTHTDRKKSHFLPHYVHNPDFCPVSHSKILILEEAAGVDFTEVEGVEVGADLECYLVGGVGFYQYYYPVVLRLYGNVQ